MTDAETDLTAHGSQDMVRLKQELKFIKGTAVRMPTLDTILLLADGFDIEGTSLALTTLRQAGLRVRVVGLRSRTIDDASGLTIWPDLSLDRLLERDIKIMALIVPDGVTHLTRLQSDPRLAILFREHLNENTILIGLSESAAALLEQLADMYAEPRAVAKAAFSVDRTKFNQMVTRSLVSTE